MNKVEQNIQKRTLKN